jgi:hypothetical protein
MARTFDPIDLIALPRLDANLACVLAQSLQAATRDENNKARKLPEAAKAALEDVEADRAALQEVLGGTPGTDSEVREVDRLEDAAIGAIHDLCEAWTRLAGQIPEGDVGQDLGRRLFGNQGLSFVNLQPRSEWGVVETKLQLIEREGLEAQIAELGGAAMLAHLRKVHIRYGEVTGATKPIVSPESPQVREKLDALLESLRHYVAAIAGSVQRRKPETKELADALLAPLSKWEAPKPKRRTPEKVDKGGSSAGGGGGGSEGALEGG